VRLELRDIHLAFGPEQAVCGLDLAVDKGEVVCLLGRSGCGKTTTLRVAAGIERQQRGSVRVDGRPVSDERVHFPPERRSVGLMFQECALFPHLTALENVGFGCPGAREEKRREAHGFLRRMGLAGHAGKYPHQLSGGQQQRIALARALAARPRCLLMDEPFSGLDARLRDGVRDEALQLLKEEGAAVLLVTHEPGEALRMGDRIALMRRGRIVQTGEPYHLYNHPVDRQAAEFFSEVNVVRGKVVSQQVDTPFGPFLAVGNPDGTRVEIVIRPEHLRLEMDLGGDAPVASPELGIPAAGRVARSRFLGSESLVEVRVDPGGTPLRATVPGTFLPPEGAPIWISLRRDRCFVFPVAEGEPGA